MSEKHSKSKLTDLPTLKILKWSYSSKERKVANAILDLIGRTQMLNWIGWPFIFSSWFWENLSFSTWRQR